MTKQYGYYDFLGRDTAKEYFKKGNHRFRKYYFYFLTSMISKLFGFSYPIFTYGDYQMMKQTEENRDIDYVDFLGLPQTSNEFVHLKRIYHLNLLTTLVGLILFGLIAFGLLSYGETLDAHYTRIGLNTAIVFYTILGVLLAMFFYKKKLFFDPIVYMIIAFPTMPLPEIFRLKKLFMTPHNRRKYSAITLVNLVKIMFFVGVGALLLYLLSFMFWTHWLIFFGIFLAFILSMMIAKITLSHKLSVFNFCADLKSDFDLTGIKSSEAYAQYLDSQIQKELMKKYFSDFFSEKDPRSIMTPVKEEQESSLLKQEEIPLGEDLKASEIPLMEGPVSSIEVESISFDKVVDESVEFEEIQEEASVSIEIAQEVEPAEKAATIEG